jgi:CzcA family heavy metal efflux pump
MGLIKASLRNPYLVATIVFMILVLGGLSLWNIPVDILPVFKAPAVQVITYYQGMPASAIEKTITNRIERWVNQAPGAATVVSKSVPGVSIVRIYFRDDTDSNAALTMTGQLALGTLATLPPNTLPPVVLPFDPTGTLPLGVLTVSNPTLDEANVKDVARITVRNELGSVKGCVAPVAVGGKDRTILIYLDPKRLEAYHLSATDVVEALKAGNMMVTPGIAYIGENQLLLDSNMMVDQVKELNDLPISVKPDANVFLRDIGHVEDSYTIQTSRVHINGRREVYVPIYRQQGASSLSVARGVQQKIKEIEAKCPPGTKLHFIMDQTVYVTEAIHSLIEEALIGAVLVSIMILIFLGNWRMTVIASISIPLSILAAIAGLYVTGNTINAMTLGGLALAIGPLVDDAIVALENTHRHGAMGKTRMRAALDGAAEVMVPVLVATLTTNIVLAPLALMPGMGGFLFRPLALAVAFAMFASFFLSRTFVPMMCAKFLPEEHHAGVAHVARAPAGFFGRAHQRIEAVFARLTLGYKWLLAGALRHRFAVLSAVGVLFLGSLALATRLGREFFPQVDAGQVTLYVRASSNLRLDATERRVAEVEDFLKQNVPAAEREMVVSEIGLDPDWSAAYTPNSGQQDAVIRVQLNEHRTKSAQEYAVELRRRFRQDPRFADLRVAFDTGGIVSTALNYGASSPIDIQVEGGSRQEGRRLAREIRNKVREVAGVADARVMQRLDAPYLIIDVDRTRAARYGLTARNVIQQVVAATNSSISIDRNFWIDNKTGNQYFVAVQYPENPNMSLDDVLNVPATGTHQTYPVKLSSLAHFRRTYGAVEINHDSLARVFNVQLNTEGRDIAGVAADVQKALAGVAVPAGMKVSMRGEFERMNQSTHDLAWGLALAALLVYFLQVALFRSWVGPFIIMFTVPLGLIGVIAMLYLTNTTLNVQSEMGVIFLVGIAVNNGVLLVEFANKQRKLGLGVQDAIVTAAGIRFRPILMTFLATFLDLIPMAIGMGRGSEANVPLARAVVGGLLTSTCLTFFVVPILYSLLIKDRPDNDAAVEAELADVPEVRPALATAGAPIQLTPPSGNSPGVAAVAGPNGDPGAHA